MLYCENCGASFDRPRTSKRRTCTRSCAVSLSWKDPYSREQRIAAMIAGMNTPQVHKKLVANNHERWARDGERDKLAALNRQRWADEQYKQQTSAAIRSVWTPHKRAEVSDAVRTKQNAETKP